MGRSVHKAFGITILLLLRASCRPDELQSFRFRRVFSLCFSASSPGLTVAVVLLRPVVATAAAAAVAAASLAAELSAATLPATSAELASRSAATAPVAPAAFSAEVSAATLAAVLAAVSAATASAAELSSAATAAFSTTAPSAATAITSGLLYIAAAGADLLVPVGDVGERVVLRLLLGSLGLLLVLLLLLRLLESWLLGPSCGRDGGVALRLRWGLWFSRDFRSLGGVGGSGCQILRVLLRLLRLLRLLLLLRLLRWRLLMKLLWLLRELLHIAANIRSVGEAVRGLLGGGRLLLLLLWWLLLLLLLRLRRELRHGLVVRNRRLLLLLLLLRLALEGSRLLLHLLLLSEGLDRRGRDEHGVGEGLRGDAGLSLVLRVRHERRRRGHDHARWGTDGGSGGHVRGRVAERASGGNGRSALLHHHNGRVHVRRGHVDLGFLQKVNVTLRLRQMLLRLLLLRLLLLLRRVRHDSQIDGLLLDVVGGGVVLLLLLGRVGHGCGDGAIVEVLLGRGLSLGLRLSLVMLLLLLFDNRRLLRWLLLLLDRRRLLAGLVLLLLVLLLPLAGTASLALLLAALLLGSVNLLLLLVILMFHVRFSRGRGGRGVCLLMLLLVRGLEVPAGLDLVHQLLEFLVRGLAHLLGPSVGQAVEVVSGRVVVHGGEALVVLLGSLAGPPLGREDEHSKLLDGGQLVRAQLRGTVVAVQQVGLHLGVVELLQQLLNKDKKTVCLGKM